MFFFIFGIYNYEKDLGRERGMEAQSLALQTSYLPQLQKFSKISVRKQEREGR